MTSGTYRVDITKSAEKEMDKFPAHVRERIAKALLLLETNPRPFGCKKLAALERYRIRAGKYRVLYSIDDARRIVTVVSVKPRGEAYRHLRR